MKAENEEETILKAREIEINKDELLNNFENWEDADETNIVQEN